MQARVFCAPLDIYGPPGTKNLMDNILEAYAADIHERIHGPEGANDTGWQVNVHEFSKSGLISVDENVSVEVFSHLHGTLPSFGFRFTTPEKVVVWDGDVF